MLVCWSTLVAAQSQATLQDILQDNSKAVEKASRKTIDGVVEALITSGLPEVRELLGRWQDKELYLRKDDGLFVYAEREGDGYALTDISTGEALGSVGRRDVKQLKPNSGVRGVIASAMVRFQLMDPNPLIRSEGVRAIERNPEPSHLAALRGAIEGEENEALKARKIRLERLLTVSFAEDPDERVAAIRGFEDDLGVDVRAALNPLLSTTRGTGESVPENANIAARLEPGEEGVTREEAYALLKALGMPFVRRREEVAEPA